MSKSDSLQGSLDVLVLKILSRRPRSHGYAIMSRHQGVFRRRAFRRGRLALSRPPPDGRGRLGPLRMDQKDSGRRARIYELTAAGKKQLAQEQERWQAVTSAVNRVLRTV